MVVEIAGRTVPADLSGEKKLTGAVRHVYP
jgi:hypothetical protein